MENKSPKQAYSDDWKTSGYVLTNAVSSGAFMLLFIGLFLNHILEQPFMSVRPSAIYTGAIISLVFLTITGFLLAKDIKDYPSFLRRLLNPTHKTPFVNGAYAITIFGILTLLFAISISYNWRVLSIIFIYLTAFSAFSVSLYTSYLLGHHKKKHHWNSFALSVHMLGHSLMAGGAAYSIVDAFYHIGTTWGFYVDMVLQVVILINLVVNVLEFMLTWQNSHQSDLVKEIISGKFSTLFWLGNVLIGNVIPFLIIFFTDLPLLQTVAGLGIIIGIYIIDKIWIDAPKYVNARDRLSVINNS